MKREIKFTACEYLDFNDNYSAKKDLIISDGVAKICWNRPVIDESYPQMVQFCKKHGRLNDPQCCLKESNKMCSDYKDFEHTVNF